MCMRDGAGIGGGPCSGRLPGRCTAASPPPGCGIAEESAAGVAAGAAVGQPAILQAPSSAMTSCSEALRGHELRDHRQPRRPLALCLLQVIRNKHSLALEPRSSSSLDPCIA